MRVNADYINIIVKFYKFKERFKEYKIHSFCLSFEEGSVGSYIGLKRIYGLEIINENPEFIGFTIWSDGIVCDYEELSDDEQLFLFEIGFRP